MEGMTIRARLEHGDGFLNDGLTFTGYPVVGYSHNMQTSGGCEEASSPVTPTGIDLNIFSDGTSDCEGGMSNTIESATTNTVCTCFWNPDLNTSMLFHDVAIAVPISRAKDAVLEIKKLRDLRQKTMCRLGVLGGLFMRFQAKSKAYLGEADDSVTFEFCQYKKREANIPKLQQDFFEEIEQMLLVKFGGKPHWGKNRILAFDDMHRRVRAMEKFLQVRERLDPFRLFSNEWTDAILGDGSIPRSAQILQDHCAFEGLCICREDSHCHPGRGFFCRPGYVFNEARVCRHEASTV
ncbi:hypothetical protein KP509_30G041700 [Ceratopteris richardii]|nr:hypothetical protein KP509_30G041700 [Ceratopteris richardii]